MNYRHAFHAGNFADVFKHIVLTALTQSFLRKDNAFCYLDTHAGIGGYDLSSIAAQKSKEFETGISKIFSAENPPALIRDYLQCVRKLNLSLSPTTDQEPELHFYPGSPYIVDCFLRPEDRMVLCELHEEDYQSLKKFFPHQKQIAVHHKDAYEGLKAFLPPKERRGLVLIDPPYEQPDEFEKLLTLLPQTIQRFETGVFALWYPIKERRATQRFVEKLQSKISRPTLTTELSVYPENTLTHLNGSGVMIVNPPWQLDKQLKEVLPWLWKVLSVNGQGRYSVDSL